VERAVREADERLAKLAGASSVHARKFGGRKENKIAQNVLEKWTTSESVENRPDLQPAISNRDDYFAALGGFSAHTNDPQ
jgi:hypothetical protein